MILAFAVALSAAGLHLNRLFVKTLLHQAQKLEAIGRLTGGISHDFNNLLSVIIANLAMAISRVGNMPAILPLLESALRAEEREATLTQRLLAFARKQRLDPRSMDLNRLVVGMEDLLHGTLGDRIRVAITADADLAPARVDANQLELAILNLAINARHAMPDGGLPRIILQNRSVDRNSPPELSAGEYVVVSIRDSGTGMDETTLAQTLEPFLTTKEVRSGSGLGLPMVHGLVAQSGGALQIQSKVGEGTTVDVWLSRADVPSEAAGNTLGVSTP